MYGDLQTKHCMEVLDQELLIGSDNAKDGKRKKFTFHVFLSEYRVIHNNEIIESGQAVEELLETYNSL